VPSPRMRHVGPKPASSRLWPPSSPSRTRATLSLLAALLLATLVAPPTALGSVVRIESGSLTYTAEPGESNGLAIFEIGPDTYEVSDSGATITAGPGCAAGGGPQTICTGSITAVSVDVADGRDTVTLEFLFTPLQSRIAGGEDDDRLTGHSGNDTIDGGNGEDGLYGLGAGDSLEGSGGDDRVRGDEPFEFTPPPVVGSAGDDSLSGGAGNDRVDGDDGNDTVTGGSGDDTYGGATAPPTFCDQPPPCPAPPTNGTDTFSGGPGRDLADYSLAGDALAVSLDDFPNDGESQGEGDNIRADVEDVVGGSAADTLIGSEADNRLDGAGNNDRSEGRGGNDILLGGEGDAGSDNLDGGDGTDALDGGPSDDELIGAGGNDSLDGDSGQDNLQGGVGNDVVQGGPGSDPSVAGGEGDDGVYGANAGTPVGGDGNDVVTGGSGDDSLNGGAANDTLDGADGSDSLGGGEGVDTALYRRDARVVVTLDGQRNDGQLREGDNVAQDVESAEGGRSQDDLVGSESPNTLASGEDEDYIDGAGEGDTLLGGGAGDVVRSRDGVPDMVDCGAEPGADFAIADVLDSVQGCETVESSLRAPPVRGRRVVVRPDRGAPRFGPTGISRTVPLKDRIRIPVGSQVDATDGRVRLASAGRRRQQAGKFSGGRFRVRQRRRTSLTVLRLIGGDFTACRQRRSARGRGAVAADLPRKVIRQLRASARGRFKASGRHSAATVRGTVFTMTDRCDGTLTVVRKGSVRIFDFTRRRTVVLRAGERYLARARR
jgi:Ca2+-binding RTX toxin-like protein